MKKGSGITEALTNRPFNIIVLIPTNAPFFANQYRVSVAFPSHSDIRLNNLISASRTIRHQPYIDSLQKMPNRERSRERMTQGSAKTGEIPSSFLTRKVPIEISSYNYCPRLRTSRTNIRVESRQQNTKSS